MFSALPMSENFTFSPSFYAPAGSVQKHTPVVSSPLSSSSLQPSPLRPPLGPGLDNGSPFGGAFNFDFMSSSPPAQQFVGSENERRSEGKKKVVKKNPLIHREGTDNGRETRRKLFLKKVREDSNEKAWERRGGDEEVSFPPVSLYVSLEERQS